MPDKKIIAIVGSTGAQGGGLARAILADPDSQFAVRALTRNVDSEKARALADLGADVVAVDFDDEESVVQAFKGAYGAYCVTFYWDYLSADKELEQAEILAEATKAAGVEHVIWSTLPDTRPQYPLDDDRMPSIGRFKVPHFDGKAEADEFFRERRVPTTFLQTVFYYENFIYFGLEPKRNGAGVLTLGLPLSRGKLPFIAAEDIGRCTLAIFEQGQEMVGQTVRIMGDQLTGDEVARAMQDAFGETVLYESPTYAQFAAFGFPGADDLANMFQYFSEQTDMFARDFSIEQTRTLNPALQSFSTWLATNKDRIPVH
ncbi:NmrA/HSCARG family protein [Kribbella sp. NPDC058693]|uniref:NmrA/HSCARG family protein n=1 Tax=Kribbella sp. NPDC058693 TaxID=3346602 RepID=UPI00365E56B7